MFIIFFYAITVLSRNCEAETQRQLCEYVSCPDYNDEEYHYEDCKTLDPGSVKIEGNFNFYNSRYKQVKHAFS